MPSIINASSSGSGGIVQTADASGVLLLQSNSTTGVTVDLNGITSVGVVPSNVVGNLNVAGNGSSGTGWCAQFGDTAGTKGILAGVRSFSGLTYGSIGALGASTMLLNPDGGQVVTPSQAGFWAYNTTTFTSSGTVPWNATVFNRGSFFNTSTYTFTAPVTGAYWFNMIVTNAGTVLTLPLISLNVNGARHRDFFESNPMPNANTELHSSILTYLTAGDAVTVNANGATTIEGGTNPAFYSAFQGYLIG